MRCVIGVVVALTVVFAVPTGSLADRQIRILVTVMDDLNRPIPGAKVEYYRWQGTSAFHCITNARGKCEMTSKFSLRMYQISARGFKTKNLFGEHWQPRPGQDVRKKVVYRLERKGPPHHPPVSSGKPGKTYGSPAPPSKGMARCHREGYGGPRFRGNCGGARRLIPKKRTCSGTISGPYNPTVHNLLSCAPAVKPDFNLLCGVQPSDHAAGVAVYCVATRKDPRGTLIGAFVPCRPFGSIREGGVLAKGVVCIDGYKVNYRIRVAKKHNVYQAENPRWPNVLGQWGGELSIETTVW
jgi:hypothetical protein